MRPENLRAEELIPETLISIAISKMKDEAGTRAASISITRLEEAQMWLTKHREELKAAARRAGHSPTSPSMG